MKADNKTNTYEHTTQLRKWNMINSCDSPCVFLSYGLTVILPPATMYYTFYLVKKVSSQ